jgi:hypothetical protein
MKKLCRDCGKTKDKKFFTKRKSIDKHGEHHLNGFCKPCMVKRTQAWKKKNE